jgi:PKD repeat protein
VTRRSMRRLLHLAVVGALTASGLTVVAVLAPAALAVPGPVAAASGSMVTADSLPTVQIDGVAWSQSIAGNTVYVGGSFANARPAGAAPGSTLTKRTNVLAYDLTTGVLSTSFAPTTNAQVQSVVASPDGSRLYIAGDFTNVSGQTRNRVAAFDTATGALISTFRPNVNGRVKTIIATNDRVYVGGTFGAVNGTPRTRLAAIRASDGALLDWAPTADYNVNALVMTPDRSKVIVGGAFTNLSGVAAYGLGAVDATTGALRTWIANQTVRNYGANSAILGLSTDGTNIYGNGYNFGGPGNLEGAFAADPNSGAIRWVQDCHGDTYATFPVNGAVYTAGHPHYCGNMGGFGQTEPWAINMRHAVAFTQQATGTINHETHGYPDWFGKPSPSMVNWFPDMAVGSYTGQSQAAWTVTGNSQYVLMGGEFPTVNGAGQQGLARFAVKPIAPSKQGPKLTGSKFMPALTSPAAGTVRIGFTANYDQDDQALTYRVVRDGNTAAPVYTTTVDSTFWNRPTIGYTDTGLTPGVTYRYRLYVQDAAGNQVIGDTATIVASGTGTVSDYVKTVQSHGASFYWRFGEAARGSAADATGATSGVVGSGVTVGAPGAIVGDPDTAYTFNGTGNGLVSTPTVASAPNVTNAFSTSAWFRTTSNGGGKIIGFGNAQTGNSTVYERHTYIDNAGRLTFGAFPGQGLTVTSPNSYLDGKWHHVVSTLGANGMVLYVDGKQVAARSDATSAADIYGFWRVGYDNVGGWPGQPGSYAFAGDIDEVSVYPTALSAAQVAAQWNASGRGVNTPSVASFTASPSWLQVTVDGSGSVAAGGDVASYSWNFGDATPAESGVNPTHTYASPGTYTIRLTVTNGAGKTATATRSVTAKAPPTSAGALVPLASSRILDTRTGQGATGPIQSTGSIAVQVTGQGGVPATGVAAVALNVTVTDATSTGYITAWPSGTPRQETSNLNFHTGQTIPNLVIVPVGADGKVGLYNGSPGSVSLIADVAGYFVAGTPTAAGSFSSLAPARLLDTRTANGASGPVPSTGAVSVQVTGRGGVPATGVSAVAVNVTVTDATSTGYITVWPSGTTRQETSNLNFQAGRTIPNMVIVPVGADGKIQLYNGSPGSVSIVADVAGYLLGGSPTVPGAFASLAPARVLDTRIANGATGPVPSTGTISVQVAGRGGIPASGVSAVALNVTVTDATSAGYITVWPSGSTQPQTSNLNFQTAQTIPNLVIVPVGADGKIQLYNGSPGSAALVADVAGYVLG